MDERLVVIRSLEGMKQLEAYIASSEYTAFDTETTSTERGAQIIGFSVSADLESGYYVVLREWDVKNQKLVDLETLSDCKYYINLLKIKNLICHNATFDCSMMEQNFGISLIDSIFVDTMLLAHLIDENRRIGLKELGQDLFGLSAKKEQEDMKASVEKNGGVLTKNLYELYKGDSELIGRYAAKDTLLTIKLFYHMIPILYEQGLDNYFFEETMPLLRGPTYDLNTTGLKVDLDKLQKLRGELEAENMELTSAITAEIRDRLKDRFEKNFPDAKEFNISSNIQRTWLLYHVYGEPFNTLTDTGKEVCESLGLRLPYTNVAKREFAALCQQAKGQDYVLEVKNAEGVVIQKAKKIKDFWCYLKSDAESMKMYENKYRWVKHFVKLTKNQKILSTYVEGIQERVKYGIIYPSFLQHGTTSTRYSSRNPNFQNLPRDDKRVKACIVARPGKVFVGADQSQLEPRTFASMCGDETLRDAFRNGSDFYSVGGIQVFKRFDAKPLKEGDPDAFGVKYPKERNMAKGGILASTYGTTAPRLAQLFKTSKEEAQDFIDKFFETFPKVKSFMLECHEKAKNTGQVESLFGRPRRIPMAKEVKRLFPKVVHRDLPYEYRNALNLSVNHVIQSTAAGIMNRSAIALHKAIKELQVEDTRWSEVKIVLQVHDELILEGPKDLQQDMYTIIQHFMENSVELPGVKLEAKPKIACNLADLK